MQSVPITAIVVSSNSVHGVKYLIHHCVIMFVRDFRQVGDVLWVLKMVSSTKKTDSHVIAEIMLKVALCTITTSIALNIAEILLDGRLSIINQSSVAAVYISKGNIFWEVARGSRWLSILFSY